MPIFLARDDTRFPPAHQTDEHGIIAIGGNFSCERLLSAYRSGIFPWPHPGLPILWFCPDPRFIMRPNHLIISRSLAKAIRRSTLTIKADCDFSTVMRRCQAANRQDQAGTWITDEMVDGYTALFQRGYAHSIEAYQDNRLVGGLYGVSLGRIFFGESMFFEEQDTSKICFVTLVAHLYEWNFTMIDCQAHTSHLERFGAEFMSRKDFLKEIKLNQKVPFKPGPWKLHLSPAQALMRIRPS